MWKKVTTVMLMMMVLMTGISSLMAASGKAGVEEIYYATSAKVQWVGECVWDCLGNQACVGQTSPYKDTYENGCEDMF